MRATLSLTDRDQPPVEQLSSMRRLTGQQVADEGLAGWVHLGNGLYTRVAVSDFATGLAFVNAIGAATEPAHHHPDVSLHAAHVDIALSVATSRVSDGMWTCGWTRHRQKR